jgi:glycosyltransferase involved in cell wall biosynthesis
MVHEPFVPLSGCRQAVMGVWQRAQLRALGFVADVIFASTEKWAERLGATRPQTPTHHLAVGSNLPDMWGFRREERNRLGVADDAVVLASLGSPHPSRLLQDVVLAANAVASLSIPTVLLNLGAEAPALMGLDSRVVAYSPGRLPAADLARRLAAADISLAPFVDGISTRRTSLMAALQHGLAIVGTDGPLTDTILRQPNNGISLVPVSRPDLFAATTRALAANAKSRFALGASARRFYFQAFDWPVLAKRMLVELAPATVR